MNLDFTQFIPSMPYILEGILRYTSNCHLSRDIRICLGIILIVI